MPNDDYVKLLEARVKDLETKLREPKCPWPNGCLHPDILREESLTAMAAHRKF